MSVESELRTEVFIIAGDRCEWPQCGKPAEQLAHLTSKGMGGSKHRDTVENTMAACSNHALISDGLPPNRGGFDARNAQYMLIPGAAPSGQRSSGPKYWRTRDVIEPLRIWLATDRLKRSWLTSAQSQMFGTFDPTSDGIAPDTMRALKRLESTQ